MMDLAVPVIEAIGVFVVAIWVLDGLHDTITHLFQKIKR